MYDRMNVEESVYCFGFLSRAIKENSRAAPANPYSPYHKIGSLGLTWYGCTELFPPAGTGVAKTIGLWTSGTLIVIVDELQALSKRLIRIRIFTKISFCFITNTSRYPGISPGML